MGAEYFNRTVNSTALFQEKPHTIENIFIRFGLILLYCLIFLICFFGNLAVILVTFLKRKSRRVSKFCLWNMAVANFSVSLFCILQNLTLYLLDIWIFGELACKLYNFISSMCHAASIFMVVLISIERYVVLVHSLRCRQILTARTLTFIVLAVWLLSAFISLPRFFYFYLNRAPLNEEGEFGEICVPIQSMHNTTTADTIYFLLLYLIPLLVMSVLYLRIGLFLRQSERLTRECYEEDNMGTSSGRKFQTARTNFNDLNGPVMRPVRVVRSAPEDLGSLSMSSDPATSDVILIFRAQVMPQCKELPCESVRRPLKCVDCPAHVLQFESSHESPVQLEGLASRHSTKQFTWRLKSAAGPYLIDEKTLLRDTKSCYEVRHVACDTPGPSVTTVASSTQQRRKSINAYLDTQRSLHRYNRLRLSRIRYKQKARVVRMLILIVVAFAVLNLPYHIYILCLHYLPSFDMASSDANNLIALLTSALRYANCALNPILYAFMSKNFRASLRDLCCSKRRRIISNI